MRYVILITICLVTSSLFVFSQPSPEKHQTTLPKIHLIYGKAGTPFDWNCDTNTTKQIKNEWITETAARRDEFQLQWDTEGTKYLLTALNETGKPFPYQEMQATLTACLTNSMSVPLMMSVTHFLSDAEKPFPTDAFSEILFHELMHVYVTNMLTQPSLLREKYASESTLTLNHLHVMALEKLALTRNNKKELLQWMDTDYRSGDLPVAYKRAWEIVNDIEGYEVFIEELRKMHE